MCSSACGNHTLCNGTLGLDYDCACASGYKASSIRTGFALLNCTAVVSSSTAPASSSTGAIIGGAVGGGVGLVLLIVVIIVLVRKNRSTMKRTVSKRRTDPMVNSTYASPTSTMNSYSLTPTNSIPRKETGPTIVG